VQNYQGPATVLLQHLNVKAKSRAGKLDARPRRSDQGKDRVSLQTPRGSTGEGHKTETAAS